MNKSVLFVIVTVAAVCLIFYGVNFFDKNDDEKEPASKGLHTDYVFSDNEKPKDNRADIIKANAEAEAEREREREKQPDTPAEKSEPVKKDSTTTKQTEPKAENAAQNEEAAETEETDTGIYSTAQENPDLPEVLDEDRVGDNFEMIFGEDEIIPPVPVREFEEDEYMYSGFTLPFESSISTVDFAEDSPVEAMFTIYLEKNDANDQINETVDVLKQLHGSETIYAIERFIAGNKDRNSLEEKTETIYNESRDQYIEVSRTKNAAILIRIYKPSVKP
ncbi:MAG: hypothetical protein LBS21_04520 [Clostridiales bacterium]|nr:hypothetical protein [Clostridiales bacterium]